jgi:murein DD-endopeptidase MepM/ murein hydrolase activator NlpD
MQRLLLSLIILVSFSSCSSMKSGQYVYLETPAHIKKIAKNYGVTLDELKSSNSEQALLGKEWIFVPTKIGIAYLLRDTYVIEDYSSLGKGRFIWPVPQFYKVSSHFGKRGGKNHDGIDIPAPKGTPIVAVDNGVVVYSDNGIRGYGNMIVIAHTDDIFTVYAHNNSNKVDKGDSVKKGEKIAEIGNTGRSTGPHLHFEIRIKNKSRNPAQFLSNSEN